MRRFDTRGAPIGTNAAGRAAGVGVLVCCALGYGRSAAVVLLWLVRYGHCADLAAAIAVLKQARPQMVLPAATRCHIEQALRLPENA